MTVKAWRHDRVADPQIFAKEVGREMPRELMKRGERAGLDHQPWNI